jgi:hypothetical protein
VKLIDRSLVMRHEHAARALVELLGVGKTSAGADLVLHDAPKPLNRVEVRSTTGRQAMPPQLLVPVGECRRELVCPVHTATVDHHDDCFPRVAKEGHDLMDIVAQSCCIKMRDDLVEDLRSAVLDSAKSAEQHATGHAAPTPRAHPCLAFEGLFAFALAGAPRS